MALVELVVLVEVMEADGMVNASMEVESANKANENAVFMMMDSIGLDCYPMV